MGLVNLESIAIDDEADFRHVGLYADLRSIVLGAGKRALVLPESGVTSWDRASFLNLCFWDEGTADVLSEPVLAADVLMHVGWHHLAHEALRPGPEAGLLGEAIASAFDLYLVGRLLGHRPEAAFLESQVPRMLEAALAAGSSEEDFEAILAFASESPEQAFEELRQLLFDASCALSHPLSPDAAATTLERFDAHRMGCLLHHFELSTWVLRARIERLEERLARAEASSPPVSSSPAPCSAAERAGIDAAELDRALREAPDSIALLERLWVEPRVART